MKRKKKLDLSIITNILIPCIGGVVLYILNTLKGRIDTLEERTHKHVTEEEVRMIIRDNLDPIRNDIRDIKDSINKILEIYIHARAEREHK